MFAQRSGTGMTASLQAGKPVRPARPQSAPGA